MPIEIFGGGSSGKIKKAVRLISEARDLNDREFAVARTKLYEALTLVRTVPQETPGRDRAGAAARLALAHVEMAAENAVRAAQLLEEAVDLGITLSDADADYYTIQAATAERTDARAIDCYVAFVRRHACDDSAPPLGPVYSVLERYTELDEKTLADERESRQSLCDRLTSADDRLGFPYYFRGRNSFLATNYHAALDDFRDASDRGATQGDIGYYSKICLGFKHKSAHHIDQAACYFVEAARLSHNSYVACYEAGECLVALCNSRIDSGAKLGEVDKNCRQCAIALLERACRIDPRSAAAHYALGRAYYLDRNAEKAATALDTAVTLQPCADTYYEYARALRRCSAASAAIAAAESALRYAPDMLKARWLIAAVSMRQGDYYRAAEQYEAVMAARDSCDDEHRKALYGLGVCCFERGDFPTAIRCFGQLEAQDLQVSPDGRLLMARSLLRVGNLDCAEVRLMELAAEEGVRGESHYFLGCVQARQACYARAIESFKCAERASIPVERVALQMGQAYEALGQFETARATYELALEHEECAACRLRAGILSWKAGLIDEALWHLTVASPTPDVLAARAELLAECGDTVGASTAFKQAIAQAPDRADVRRRHAAVLIRSKDLEGALEALTEGGDGSLDTLYLTGLISLVSGEPVAAMEMWREIEATPNRQASIRIGALYAARQAFESGKPACALAFWDRAIDAGADSRPLRADYATASVTAALDGACAGASIDEWGLHVRCAVALDPYRPVIVCLDAAYSLLAGDADRCIERAGSLLHQRSTELDAFVDYLTDLARRKKHEDAAADTPDGCQNDPMSACIDPMALQTGSDGIDLRPLATRLEMVRTSPDPPALGEVLESLRAKPPALPIGFDG